MIPPNFTRPLFRTDAKPLPVTVGSIGLTAHPVEMGTGSLGYRGQRRTKMVIGGCLVEVQISTTVTVIGSKQVAR